VSIPSVIPKSTRGRAVEPNMVDYGEAVRTFSWERARSELDGLPGGLDGLMQQGFLHVACFHRYVFD